MRICSVDKIQEGSVLGKSIYNNKGGMLLSKGTPLSEGLIQRLKTNKNIFVYIEDDISEGITPKNAIDDETKMRITVEFKDNLDSLIKPGGLVRGKSFLDLSKIVDKLINELSYSNTKLFYTMELMGTDMQLYYHSINVAIMSILTGINMGLDKKDISKMALGALLHDSGFTQLGEDKLMLAKADSLRGGLNWGEKTAASGDRNEHVEIGYNMVKGDSLFSPIAKHIIYSHHENLDGSGYPRGINAGSIPIYTRIVTMTNEFDTMMLQRENVTTPTHEILELLMMKVTQGKLCREVYKPFIDSISIFPEGTLVKLSDNTLGIVIRENEVNPTRPVVREVTTGKEIDLTERLSIFIDNVLN